jgi:multiple sugar transport system ATP-binding protein
MNMLECTANGRIEGEGWSLPNPGFAVEGEQRAVFGVRSEDLSLDVRDEATSLAGKVYAVEPFGDRTLVDVEVGGHRVIIKAPPTAHYEVGESVRASVDMERVHLFDAESEQAIARR